MQIFLNINILKHGKIFRRAIYHELKMDNSISSKPLHSSRGATASN
jgi:hypothetical protein